MHCRGRTPAAPPAEWPVWNNNRRMGGRKHTCSGLSAAITPAGGCGEIVDPPPQLLAPTARCGVVTQLLGVGIWAHVLRVRLRQQPGFTD